MANNNDSYEQNRIIDDTDLLSSEKKSNEQILEEGKKNVPKEGQSHEEVEESRGGRQDIEKTGTCFDPAAFIKSLGDRVQKSSSFTEKIDKERERD